MARPVRFGVTLPQIKRSWEQAREAAVEFDGLGFDTAWVNDHLFGVPMPNTPIFEAYSQLAAVAAVTERMELGAFVTPPFFRQPAVLAKQIATIDHISGGRAIAGLGAGWFDMEFDGYGCEFPGIGRRLRALDESCEIMKRLWSEDMVDFDGEVYKLSGCICEPKPVRRPPIMIGGGGEKVLLRIAARHADIWNNLAINRGDLTAKTDVLKRHCDDIGRDFDSIEISQQTLVVVTETEDAANAAIVKAEAIYGGHMGGGLADNGIWGTPDAVVERIGRYVDAGCTHFVIEFFGRDTREPARLFAEHVIPAFR